MKRASAFPAAFWLAVVVVSAVALAMSGCAQAHERHGKGEMEEEYDNPPPPGAMDALLEKARYDEAVRKVDDEAHEDRNARMEQLKREYRPVFGAGRYSESNYAFCDAVDNEVELRAMESTWQAMCDEQPPPAVPVDSSHSNGAGAAGVPRNDMVETLLRDLEDARTDAGNSAEEVRRMANQVEALQDRLDAIQNGCRPEQTKRGVQVVDGELLHATLCDDEATRIIGGDD